MSIEKIDSANETRFNQPEINRKHQHSSTPKDDIDALKQQHDFEDDFEEWIKKEREHLDFAFVATFLIVGFLLILKALI